MIYQVNHSFFGRVTSIGDLNLQYTDFLQRLSAVGDIGITYSSWGRVLSIDDQPCSYNGWWSSMSGVGNMEIIRSWGRIQSIGNLSFGRVGVFVDLGCFAPIGNHGSAVALLLVNANQLVDFRKIISVIH